jgi:hypothetical protein
MARATELVGKENKKKIKRRERKEDESKGKAERRREQVLHPPHRFGFCSLEGS